MSRSVLPPGLQQFAAEEANRRKRLAALVEQCTPSVFSPAVRAAEQARRAAIKARVDSLRPKSFTV